MIDSGKIADAITDSEYEYHGLRIDTRCECGQVLPDSRIWVDGVVTTDTLNGVSALDVTSKTIDRVIQALKSGGYPGNRVLLVGADSREWGEDRGEVILKRGVCVAWWGWP